ncbi:MAG: MFS transporter [Planctomycetaceae bacterium]|jgi:nucleoside transporter|nr:MFS transporter [Planctomycetaceae bacterium]
MTETKKPLFAYPRLCVAYFCEFAIWAAWAGALSVYASEVLKLTGSQVGWLYCAIPFGAVIGPMLIGPLADRYFAAQKVMSVLHLIGGICLAACGYLCLTHQASFPVLMALMMLSGICYMPTMGLINSVVFANLPKPSMGPYVFVFGTFGWIVSCLLIAAFFGGEMSHNFFFVGGGFSIFLALYCLTLPNTPPKGVDPNSKRNPIAAALGLDAFKLFKDPMFALFAVCVFFASIPACGFYFVVQTPYLSQMGYPSPVALGTLNQISELFFMTALPILVALIGLRWVLVCGMLAWTARYIFFALPGYGVAPEYDFWFSVIGLLFHGFSYSFLYVAAYMYAERKAPANLKASVQSMMVFLLLGVGQVLGAQIYAPIAQYAQKESGQPKVSDVSVDASQVEAKDKDGKVVSLTGRISTPIPAWSVKDGSFLQYLDLAAQVKKLQGKQSGSSAKNVDLGELLGDKPFTKETLAAFPDEKLIQDGIKITNPNNAQQELTLTVKYSKDDLKQLGAKMAGGSEDFSLDRKAFLAAKAQDWKTIFTLPAVFIAVFFLVFLFFGREPKEETKE